MSFSSLKKQSSLGSLTSKLVKEIEKTSTTRGGADERLWKPELDKSGNGYAVIRFLPAPDGEDLPWAKVYSHAFQGPGGWYIENSLTTSGGKDPVSEYNRDLWNSGNDADKDVVRRQKRKLSYYANIYVVKDPVNPHNEGGVFLFKFGKKIFDKLTAAMQPEFEDETPINPFDFWQGANFKLKIRKVDGYWNYDKSEFDAPAPLLADDDALEALWKKEYSVAEFTSQSNFKSYEDLERRLKSVLGQKQAQRPRFDEEVETEDNARAPVAAAVAAPVTTQSTDADEDDALSYFQKLANE
jgi:hypothetical protein